MKPTITLKPLQHRDAEQIGIYYKNNSAINILVRSKADLIPLFVLSEFILHLLIKISKCKHKIGLLPAYCVLTSTIKKMDL